MLTTEYFDGVIRIVIQGLIRQTLFYELQRCVFFLACDDLLPSDDQRAGCFVQLRQCGGGRLCHVLARAVQCGFLHLCARKAAVYQGAVNIHRKGRPGRRRQHAADDHGGIPAVQGQLEAQDKNGIQLVFCRDDAGLRRPDSLVHAHRQARDDGYDMGAGAARRVAGFQPHHPDQLLQAGSGGDGGSRLRGRREPLDDFMEDLRSVFDARAGYTDAVRAGRALELLVRRHALYEQPGPLSFTKLPADCHRAAEFSKPAES